MSSDPEWKKQLISYEEVEMCVQQDVEFASAGNGGWSSLRGRRGAAGAAAGEVYTCLTQRVCFKRGDALCVVRVTLAY
jgi:hypothetical protein